MNGTPRRRPHRAAILPTVTYRDPADQIVVVDRAVVRQQILITIAQQPMEKWRIRETLHLPETIVYDELQVLRAEGRVKAIGKKYTDRQWALSDWTPPAPVTPIAPEQLPKFAAKKPEPLKESWWLQPMTREAFQARCRARVDGDVTATGGTTAEPQPAESNGASE